jgi:hypothetical protein
VPVIPKTGEKVGGDARPVFCRRSDVVNRRELFRKHVPRHRDRRATRSAASVPGSRTPVGVKLPMAIRGWSSHTRATAAMTTFEIACAARMPTFLNQ